MIRLYDYYGLELFFKDKAELPITIFGSRNEKVCAMRIKFQNGLVDALEFIEQPEELDHEDREIFRLLIEQNISEIIKHWLDAFLYNKEVPFEIIKSKLKSN